MNGEESGGNIGTEYERVDKQPQPPAFHGGPAAAKPAPMSFSSGDIIFAFGMLICGFLYWNLVNAGLGLGVALFAAILCTASIVYLKSAGFRQSKQGMAFLGIILLSAANFVLFDFTPVKALNFIFLSVCFVYWVCVTAGTRLENKISIYLLSDMLRQLIVVPFGNFTGCFAGIRQVLMKNSKGKGILSGVVGILFFLPVLILVITLLNDADAAFESLMDQIRFSFTENMLQYLLDIILGLPTACYLYGLIYGNRYRRNTGNLTTEYVDEQVKAFRFVPGVTVYSALTALNLIYAVFFLAQAGYLFSAFRDTLPQSMTYAEYARRGFFELSAVAGINLAVMAAAQLIAKREKIKVLRGETVALCIFTIALIATAMSKMGMYISYYGLTRLRIYTTWFMAVLLLIFVIVLIRQFRSFNGTRIAASCFIFLFLALSYGNVDGVIARYNIDRYQAGTLESLDLDALSELSDGAVPYLYELYEETVDPVVKYDLRKAILKEPPGMVNRDAEDFRDFNLQKYRADRIRETI